LHAAWFCSKLKALEPVLMSLVEQARRFLPLSAKSLEARQQVDLGKAVSLPAGYHATNPALVRYAGGYFVCVRGVNYVYESRRKLVPTFTAGRGYHSLNRFLLLDESLNVQARLTELDGYFDNVEDLRLFTHAGKIYGIGTRPMDASHGDACGMCLVAFDDKLSDATLTSIESPYGFTREKNWCPFSHAGELHFLYACAPLVIAKLAAGQTKPSLVPFAGKIANATQLRFLDCGSTPAQRTSQGYLFVTHRRSVRLPSFERVYSSRLYQLDTNLSEARCSRYFTFGERTIQFISGCHLGENDVLFAYGEMDRRALLARFDREAFMRALPLKRTRD
jgi:hypothetical protein